ncbi:MULTISPECIES: PAS domain-containing protein [unclassified Leptolyngbya]|uniref:hybrid sensor histidine kinase/response regulator n=1 Tax=unclassified Leptolyngbya TaxID=2650499 RepID=UPI00168975BE|nr:MULTISPECIES: PAS domain-containing protein [unclassified Leptolyngbya]MBD1909418.1 PAS domain-containing protein [Leptolyngbya sp. FACHB-8]MBD2157595.1 PAS domain-containing protein [Leptolyngbya sp. FACHB-16]
MSPNRDLCEVPLMLRLLLVDDNPDDRSLITRELQRGFSELHIVEVTEAAHLNQVVKRGNFDLVITDYHLHWSDGLTILREVKSHTPNCPVIMLTDSGNQEVAVEAMKSGLDDYLTKSPQHYAQLPLVIRSALNQGQQTAEQQQMEHALQQSEERLRLALHAAQMGIWDWDFQTNRITWTESNEKLFGLVPGTFDGTYEAFLELVHPEDRNLVHQTVERSLEQKTSYSLENRIVRPDGNVRWVVGNGEIVLSETGQPIRFLGTTMDITQQKESEIKLQQLTATLEQQVRERTAQLEQALEFEATLRRITDKVRDSLDESQILQTAVQELGMGLGVNSCNAALYDLKEGVSHIRYEYNPPLFPMKGHVCHLAKYPEIYQPLLHGQSIQFCNLGRNPIRGWVAMLACPMFVEHEVLGDIWLIIDKEYGFKEQELRLVQQVANHCAIALRQARLYQAAQTQVQELEKLNQLKDDFLSTVSHELRTPVSNMKMAIRMLKLKPSGDRAQRYWEILEAECDREAMLVNDLLDLQQLETTSPVNELTGSVDLHDWLPPILTPFKARAQEHQQTFEVSIASDLPSLLVDLKGLERVLTELLNNACKYTPAQGRIAFSADYSEDSSSIQIAVGNQAEISAEELPRIFEKFYRIPNADPWKRGGTGLGLALVKKLVEHMSGAIAVESHDGWTRFIVSFQRSF